MRIAIAVLTYNRLPALKVIKTGLAKWLQGFGYQFAIFDDAGYKDATAKWLIGSAKTRYDHELLAVTEQPTSDDTFFIGTENLGVAGNSNRAIRWFERLGYDYLLLCNDDLIVKGNFAQEYTNAAVSSGVELLSYCGFSSPEYACTPVKSDGVKLKILSRLTGSMLCISKRVLKDVGYFNPIFGKFGEEHCDYQTRCKLAGHQQVNGQMVDAVDIANSTDYLEQQEVASTVSSAERDKAGKVASAAYSKVSYMFDGLYQPFRLKHRTHVSGSGEIGMPVRHLLGAAN